MQFYNVFLKMLCCVACVAVMLMFLCSFEENSIITEDSLYDSILIGMLSMEEIIDVSRHSPESALLQREFTKVLKNTPELYYVSTKFSYDAVGGKIIRLYPSYSMNETQRELASEVCNAEIQKALLLIDENACDMEKAQLLHDYLCLNFSYDESLSSDNMYSFFDKKQGTCQGYTYTYMALLRAAGIECTFVASDSMMHIWNIAKIDGEWYHVDVTWDDYPEMFASVEYDSFLKSDDAIRKTSHRDWFGKEEIGCNSYKYDNMSFISPLKSFIGTGDVNCDGTLDVLDLVLLESEKGQFPNNHAFLIPAADIDGDRALTDIDSALIRQSVLG